MYAKQKRYSGRKKLPIFSIIETKLDIAITTSIVSQFAKNPSCQHTKAVKTIMKYLKAMRILDITYNRDKKDD